MTKTVVFGGTGLIGKHLVKSLLAKNYEVVVFSRDQHSAERYFGREKNLKVIGMGAGGSVTSSMIAAADGAHTLINLAGENIFDKRWTTAQKQKVLESRIETTRTAVSLLSEVKKKFQVFISASAVGYYGSHGKEPITETTPPGKEFLSEVCVTVEEHAKRAKDYVSRIVLPRIGVVLAPDGGALSRLCGMFVSGCGGIIGTGTQVMPWIHIEDAIGIIETCITNSEVIGPVNVVSPAPVTNKEFMTKMAELMNMPCAFAVTPAFLKVGLGEMGNTFLASQNVVPKIMKERGYKYKYSDYALALKNLLVAK